MRSAESAIDRGSGVSTVRVCGRSCDRWRVKSNQRAFVSTWMSARCVAFSVREAFRQEKERRVRRGCALFVCLI